MRYFPRRIFHEINVFKMSGGFHEGVFKASAFLRYDVLSLGYM